MTPRSSAISGRRFSSACAASNTARARPAHPAPAARVGRARRHRPVRREAAEVVDAREVEELERAPEALGPPAVAAALHRRPVVDRVAPQLALVGEQVRRRARLHAGAEQLGVARRGRRCRARRRSARRRSAARRARAHRHAAPPTRGRSAPGRRSPACRRRTPPSRRSRSACARAELVALGGRHRGARIGQQPAPRRERRRGLVGRPVAVGRPERQDLPPRLSRGRQPVHEPVRRRAQTAVRERREMQLQTAGSGEGHVGRREGRARPRQGSSAFTHKDRAPHPNRGFWPLAGQADDRGHGAGLRRHLPRRP